MTVRIISWDPGETTGMVYADAFCKEDGSLDRIIIRAVHQYEYSERFYFEQYMGGIVPHVFLVERFLLYKHKAKDQVNSTFKTVRVIGHLEHLAHRMRSSSGYPYYWVEQNATVMGRVEVLPEHVNALDRMPHATSAYKHLRYFCVSKGKDLLKHLQFRHGSIFDA